MNSSSIVSRATAHVRYCGIGHHPGFVLREEGMSLVIVLIFTVIIALLGITAMRTTRNAEALVGVRYERATALSGAKAGISDSYDYLFREDVNTSTDPKIVDIQRDVAKMAQGWTVESWVRANTDWVGGATTFRVGDGNGEPMNPTRGYAAQRPAYIIERIADENEEWGKSYQVFRVTARAVGVQKENSAYVQTIVRMPVSQGN